MKKAAVVLFCVGIILIRIKVVAAHQPHITEKDVTIVKRPEISQAFMQIWKGCRYIPH